MPRLTAPSSQAGTGIGWLEVAGHSIAAGGGARVVPHGGYAYLLAQALGIPKVHDYAIGGAIACRPTAVGTGDGGFAWVLRNLLRPGRTGVAATPGVPYSPMSQLVLCHFGLNDLGELGAVKPLPFQTALRSILSGFCAASFSSPHDSAGNPLAGWTFTGAWASSGIIDATASSSDPLGVHYTQTVNDKVVRTLDADVPDGRVHQLRLWLNATWAPVTYGLRVRQSGTWTALPDLVLTPSAMTDQGVPNMHIMHTLRFGSGVAGDPYGAIQLKAGDQIEVTLKAGSMLAVDGSAVECDPAHGPRFICPLPHKPANYSIWSGWPGGASMNDTVVDQWKDYERAILAEFPGRVLTDPVNGLLGIDLDNAGLNRYTTTGGGNPAPAGVQPDQIADGAHPTDAGHGKLAKYVAGAVRSSPLVSDDFRVRPFVDPTPRAWKKIGQVNGAGAFVTGWSNFSVAGLSDLQWRIDERRRVFVRGTVKAAAGATGTILGSNTLPRAGYLVSKVANQYNGASWNAPVPLRCNGGVTGTTGNLQIAATVVTAAGNFLEFDIDYQAEV